MRADTLTYVTLTAAGELLGREPHEIEAMIADGTLDGRDDNGILRVSRVSLNGAWAAMHRAELRAKGIRP